MKQRCIEEKCNQYVINLGKHEKCQQHYMAERKEYWLKYFAVSDLAEGREEEKQRE